MAGLQSHRGPSPENFQLQNVELFNKYATALLVSLYDTFPVPLHLAAEDYVIPPENGALHHSNDETDEDGQDAAITSEYDRRRAVFAATVHFLHNERLIRFLHPKNMRAGTEIAPTDILLDRATAVGSKQRLSFVLTAHGLAQLSKTVSGGKVTNDTLISKLKATMATESIKATPGLVVSSAIPWIGVALGSP